MPKNKPTRCAPESQAAFELRGPCTVEEAGRIRSLLVEQMREKDRLALNLEAVGSADLSFLQILCAAHKSALHAKKTIVVDGALPESLIQKVREAGFASRRECGPDLNKDCLWTEV